RPAASTERCLISSPDAEGNTSRIGTVPRYGCALIRDRTRSQGSDSVKLRDSFEWKSVGHEMDPQSPRRYMRGRCRGPDRSAGDGRPGGPGFKAGTAQYDTQCSAGCDVAANEYTADKPV